MTFCIFLYFYCISMSLSQIKKNNKKNITFQYLNCCILHDKSMRNNSETDKNKSAQYKVKSRHYKWLLLITENILKHPTNFSTTHVRLCVKGRYAPALKFEKLNDVRSLKFGPTELRRARQENRNTGRYSIQNIFSCETRYSFLSDRSSH